MEHTRIDEGVKRGPRKKPGRKPRSPRRNNGDFLPILSNKPEDIKAALQDYISGSTLEEIGQRHGVTRQAVYGWLLGEMGGAQHTELVTRALTARIARADEVLETGTNALDVTRGERMARHYRTDLERRRSSLYGQKQEVTHVVQPVLTINTQAALVSTHLPVIEAQVVVDTPNGAVLQPSTLSKSTE